MSLVFSQALHEPCFHTGATNVTQKWSLASQFPGSGQGGTGNVTNIEPQPCESMYCDARPSDGKVATDRILLGSRPGASKPGGYIPVSAA